MNELATFDMLAWADLLRQKYGIAWPVDLTEEEERCVAWR